MAHYTNRGIPQPSSLECGSVAVYSSGWKNSIRAYGNSETPVCGALFENTSDAAVGADSASPYVEWKGRAWDTSPAGSVEFSWRAWCLPSKAATPGGKLQFDYLLEGGSWTNVCQVTHNLGLQADMLYASSGYLRVGADYGSGVASSTIFTNVSLSAGSNSPTMINVPGSGAAAQVGWMKIYIGTTAYAVPYWAAA